MGGIGGVARCSVEIFRAYWSECHVADYLVELVFVLVADRNVFVGCDDDGAFLDTFDVSCVDDERPVCADEVVGVEFGHHVLETHECENGFWCIEEVYFDVVFESFDVGYL